MLHWFASLPPWVWIAIFVHAAVLGTVAYLILLERKVASWVQDRIGPNRVGFKGLLQPLADGLKFIVKEDYRPAGVDKVLFTLAPALMIFVVIISIAVVPWGGTHQVTRTVDVTAAVAGRANLDAAKLDTATARSATVGDTAAHAAALDAARHDANGDLASATELKVEPAEADANDPTLLTRPAKVLATVTYRYPFQIASLNIGVLFVLAVLSLAVYGVVIGGWASNNKFSFLGGLRATAQMISYEIPLGLCVLCIVVMFGTLDLGEIVDKQAHYWLGFIPAWNCFAQPITFLMFLVCIHAEANRAPFDLAEAEQELVGGYHTEYSSMRFALFFLAEYAGMITTSAVCVALFFGGWHLPWLEWLWPALRGDVSEAHPSVTTSLLACLVRAGVFFGKTLLIIFVFMWTRWSLPRFRFDQLMMLAWRAMIPLSLALLMVTAVVVWAFGDSRPLDPAGQSVTGQALPGPLTGGMALALMVANVVLIVVSGFVSLVLPPAPETNRRVRVIGSRFGRTPLPGAGATAVARDRPATAAGPAHPREQALDQVPAT